MMPDLTEAILLSEYTRRMVQVVSAAPNLRNQWVQAETSDVQERNGHCYLELIEKNPDTGQPIARLKAIVWANVYKGLKENFLSVTGSAFTSGIRVKVCITADYHQQYGMKAVITAIDAEFTLGDAVRLRREIRERLQREGLLNLNRNKPFVPVPQRIAVISAAGAAGYGDFTDQLAHNKSSVVFYTKLFPAVMQGTNTASSVIAAIQAVERVANLFDCVVIIRGGGSTTDLLSFDNYDLAAAVARCCLPVVVGIGHERDTTILDDVAAQPVKTPTAAAEWLIGRGTEALHHLAEQTATVAAVVRSHLSTGREQLTFYQTTLRAVALRITGENRLRLQHLGQTIPMAVRHHVERERVRLGVLSDAARQAVTLQMERQNTRITTLSEKLELLSPRSILNRGYTLTMMHGRFITDVSQLSENDTVTTHFANGRISAVVRIVRKTNDTNES